MEAKTDKQIEEMALTICGNKDCTRCVARMGLKECGAKVYAERFYNADYRKASDVAREIFEDFRAEMRAEIARNEALLKMEDDDDFYEGRNDAYRTAINYLAELKKEIHGGEG